MLSGQENHWKRTLSWSGAYPRTDEVRELSQLLIPLTGKSNVVRSAAQLGARINMLRHHEGDVAALARQEIERNGAEADDAIEEALEFARNWAQFNVPRALSTISSLTRDVWGPSAPKTDMRLFAGQLENMFMPPFTTVLEEYGLPTSTTLKLRHLLSLDTARDLDDVLGRLRTLQNVPTGLVAFEREMLADTLATL